MFRYCYCLFFLILFFFFFFFSSRRRHTRCLSDWSSDVCSSDLDWCYLNNFADPQQPRCLSLPGGRGAAFEARSEERRVGKSVDLGGRRIIKKKKKKREKSKKGK